jgi:hypothetical protein
MKKNHLFLLLTLVVGILIWVQINLLREQETLIYLRANITNLPDDLYLYPIVDTSVPFHAKGKGFRLVQLAMSDFSIDYDASATILGQNTLEVSKLQTHISPTQNVSLSVTETDRELIYFADRLIQVSLPVKFEFSTEDDMQALIEQNYTFSDYYVMVSGPVSLVSEVSSISTVAISATIMRSDSPSVRLLSPDEHIIITPGNIELSAVSDMISTRTLSGIPIVFDESLYTIFPSRISIRVEGRAEILNSLTIDDIYAYIDKADDRHSIKSDVMVKMPANVTMLDFTPTEVNIRMVENHD